jgi:hypothetical protein
MSTNFQKDHQLCPGEKNPNSKWINTHPPKERRKKKVVTVAKPQESF